MLSQTNMKTKTLQEHLKNRDFERSTKVAKDLLESEGYRPVLAELIVAASEEVNWKSIHQPTGLVVMKSVVATIEKSENKLEILQRAIKFVCRLNRVPPGPAPLLPVCTLVQEWDLTELIIELLRVVRKSNYYKVYSILVTIKNEADLFQAMYSVASVVPGARGYNMILIHTLQRLYPYLSDCQKKLVLLSFVELFTTLVQSSRYTSTLLYLVRLNHLNEFREVNPKQEYGHSLIDWLLKAPSGEIYSKLNHSSYTSEEIFDACRQMTSISPGRDGINVLQALSFGHASEYCRNLLYFNNNYMWKYLIRELKNSQALTNDTIPDTRLQFGQSYLCLPTDNLLSLKNLDLMDAALAVSEESEISRQNFLSKLLETGFESEISGFQIPVLDGYLEFAAQTTGQVQASFVYKALKLLKKIKMIGEL